MIRIYVDHDALAGAAADLFVAHGREAVVRRGAFAVALAGGRTPRRTYQLLAESPRRDQVDWDRVHVFWSDERCVAPDDSRHNARLARTELLAHVPVPPDHVHAITCADDPHAAAAAYEQELVTVLGEGADAGLDLAMLGLGADGHLASLFPAAASLAERERCVVAVPAEDSGDVPRVTLTAPFLNRARRLVILVTGEEKAPALQSVLEGPHDPERWPAQLVERPGGDGVLWLVDREASGGLTGGGAAEART